MSPRRRLRCELSHPPNLAAGARCGGIHPQFAFLTPTTASSRIPCPPCFPLTKSGSRFPPLERAASSPRSQAVAPCGAGGARAAGFAPGEKGAEGAEQVGDLGRLRFLLRGCGSKARRFPLHLLTPESNRCPSDLVRGIGA